MLSRSASLRCKPRNPSLLAHRPPLRRFLLQRPRWTHLLLRHRVTFRVPERHGTGMAHVLTPCVNRSVVRMGRVRRVMALSLSVMHSPSGMGSVDR